MSEIETDELVRQTEANGYELINGKLVEKSMGAESSEVGINVATLLSSVVRAQKLGRVFGADCGIQAFPGDKRKVRKPDVSFVASDRLSGNKVPRGNLKIAPDLIVEVVSPNDLAEEIEERVADYTEAGVKLIWVVYTLTKSVWVFSADGAARLTGSQLLTGGTVIPSLSVPVVELFPEL